MVSSSTESWATIESDMNYRESSVVEVKLVDEGKGRSKSSEFRNFGLGSSFHSLSLQNETATTSADCRYADVQRSYPIQQVDKIK